MQCLQGRQTFVASPSRRPSVQVNALFSKKKPAAQVVEKPKKEEEEVKQSIFAQTLNAFDFTATRSKKDARLLYDAKAGKVGDDGKLTPEQYQALRRKVIGTAKDYWKDWVEDEADKNIKTYYKPQEAGGSVPYLPFLVGVIVAMLATTVVVVMQTA